MKKFLKITSIVAVMVFVGVVASPLVNAQITGNGSFSGVRYTLNLIGVPEGKTVDMAGSNGHRIFVPLSENCKIELSIGDFQVLDGNCTDGSAAFQLPNPDPKNTTRTAYSIYAAAVGKPGGEALITTCAIDPATGGEACSTLEKIFVRDEGKQTFGNVSREFLYVYFNNTRYNLFSDDLEDYFWSYDNAGLKVLQLRFYEVPNGPTGI